MLDMISNFLTTVDDFVWGIPLIVLILATGLFSQPDFVFADHEASPCNQTLNCQ